MVFALDSLLPGQLRQLRRQKAGGQLSTVQHLTLILNVGCTSTSTYISDCTRSGCHWTLATVDLQQHKIVYCDSLGWTVPYNLIEKCQALFDISDVSKNVTWQIIPAHTPNTSCAAHVCTDTCLTYPLQKCGNICGAITLVVAVISVKKETIFRHLIGPKSTKTLLHQPTKYGQYLRRQIVKWCATGDVNVRFLENVTFYKDLCTSSNREEASARPHKVTNVNTPDNSEFAEKIKMQCLYCSVIVSRRDALVRHVKRMHPDKQIPELPEKGTKLTMCHMCLLKCSNFKKSYTTLQCCSQQNPVNL